MKSIILLISASAAGFLVSSARADEQCKLVIGQSCQGQEVYIMNFNRGSNSANRGDCQNLPTICKLSQFQPWIREFKSSGDSRHGIYGPLDNSDAVDSKGRMLLVADKFVTKCFKKRRNGGSWEHQGTQRCEKSDEMCGGGLVFNPTLAKCEVKAPSGDTDSADASGAIGVGFQMVEAQLNHFSTGDEINPNLQQSHAVAGTDETGLIEPKAATAGKDISFKSSSPTGRGSRSGKGALGSAGMNGSGAFGAATAGGMEAGKEPEKSGDASQFASMSFGLEKDGVVSGTGGENGIGKSGGPSWFGSGGDSATAGGSSGDQGFGEGSASRGLASGEMLKVEDPANYFMMSDIDLSLFKRVTAQCRKKEKDLVLAP